LTPEYLAGFFDGEGTFYIGKQFKKGKEYPHATILLSQSGEGGLALLELIQSMYGGSIYKHLSAGQYKATKPAYKLYWNKVEGIELCKTLIPHLILKKEAAVTVLLYLERKKD
jgi:LAGLIDADG endonuclease